MSQNIVFSLDNVKQNIADKLTAMVNVVLEMHADLDNEYSIEDFIQRVEERTGFISQNVNTAINAHNLTKLLAPVLTANLPLHPEIGITVNGILIRQMMDTQGVVAKDHLEKEYAGLDYTCEPIPVPNVKEHQVLKVVTTLGEVIGYNTVFRSYNMTGEAVQVELSELPIIRTLDGWVDYATILGWKEPTEEEAETFKKDFLHMLESANNVTESQINQTEKWIFEGGLYNEQLANMSPEEIEKLKKGELTDDEQKAILDRGDSRAVDVPLEGKLGDNIKAVVNDAANLPVEELVYTADTDSKS